MSFASRFMLVLIVAAASAGGCATSVTPPAQPPDPLALYLADYGRHSSLLLPAPQGHMIEYAFGDWDWFALGKTSAGDGVRALFFSRASTLGRRQLDLAGQANIDDVARRIGADRVIPFRAARQRVDALRRRLDGIYYRHHQTVTYEPSSDMWFVRYDGGYSGCHNCNHATKAWLQSLGCRVRGPGLTSAFVLNPADRADGAAPPLAATVR